MGKQRSKPVEYLSLSSDRADNGPDLVRSITNGEFIYSRNFMPYMPQMRYIRYIEIADITNKMRSDFQKGQLNALQKSIFKERPAEFLFNIKNDIWETNNLVQDPAYKEVLEKLRKQLDKRILQTRDVHFLPEYELGTISENVTAYEYRQRDKKYPIKEIYAAASLSGKKGANIVNQQLALLKSENKIVRYWAMLGLRSQNPEDLEPLSNEIIHSLSDDYLPVVVTAAAIAYQNFAHAEAEKKLKEFCKSENMDIALMAINYLLYLDNKQPFVETIQTVYELLKRNYNVKAACLDFLGILKLVTNDFENEVDYLADLKQQLTLKWPDNKTINVVFHGHSVPAGYFKTPDVRTLAAYPHLFLKFLKENFPTAVINSITTAIGGEQSEQGARRFKTDVLNLKPELIFIDYALNDRRIGLERAEVSWRSMIEQALAAKVKVVLLTPTPDLKEDILDDRSPLADYALMIKKLGREFQIPVVDVYAQFKELKKEGKDISDYMSQGNHPNALGHQVVLSEIENTLFNKQK